MSPLLILIVNITCNAFIALVHKFLQTLHMYDIPVSVYEFSSRMFTVAALGLHELFILYYDVYGFAFYAASGFKAYTSISLSVETLSTLAWISIIK